MMRRTPAASLRTLVRMTPTRGCRLACLWFVRAMVAACLLFAVAPHASAQDVHVLVVTGVSGDDEHAVQFQKWAGAVVDAAKKHGVLDANVNWLAEAPDKDPRIKGRASRDGVGA